MICVLQQHVLDLVDKLPQIIMTALLDITWHNIMVGEMVLPSFQMKEFSVTHLFELGHILRIGMLLSVTLGNWLILL